MLLLHFFNILQLVNKGMLLHMSVFINNIHPCCNNITITFKDYSSPSKRNRSYSLNLFRALSLNCMSTMSPYHIWKKILKYANKNKKKRQRLHQILTSESLDPEIRNHLILKSRITRSWNSVKKCTKFLNLIKKYTGFRNLVLCFFFLIFFWIFNQISLFLIFFKCYGQSQTKLI